MKGLAAVLVLLPSMALAEPTFVIASWKAKLYGFAELDTMLDSTQSFAEVQGNGIIVKPGASYDSGRFQETIRNTRLGFALESPEVFGVKGSALIEGDFFGFDPNPAYPSSATQPSESGFYTSPTFRIRHAWVKIESQYVDVLGGQTWSLLGGAGAFQPASVALQGLNGEIYQRTEQVRIGKTFGVGSSKVEVQVAALRPYQRDAAVPDLSAMVRVEAGGWTGYKSSGGTGGGLANLQFAVSAVAKQFRAAPGVTASGSAIALDAIVPILPATKESHAGSVTLVAEASTGSGYNDAFTGLSAGIGGTTSTIDAGAAGMAGGALTAVDYQSLLVNLQAYVSSSVLLSGIFSEMASDNSFEFVKGGNGTYVESKYASLALLWDVTPAVRAGVEGAWTRQHLSDAHTRVNRRALASLWFRF